MALSRKFLVSTACHEKHSARTISGSTSSAALTVVSAPVIRPSWFMMMTHCAAKQTSAMVATVRPIITLDSQVLNRQMRCTSARGSVAAEFALALPVLVLFLAGIALLGVLFAANAGLQQAVGEGARLATLYPRPDDATITARIRQAAFALNATNLDAPALTHGVANGVPYVDISLTYHPQLNFILFSGPHISLTRSRRAYIN